MQQHAFFLKPGELKQSDGVQLCILLLFLRIWVFLIPWVSLQEKCACAKKDMLAAAARIKMLHHQDLTLQEEAKNIRLVLRGWGDIEQASLDHHDLEWFENQHADWQKRLEECKVRNGAYDASAHGLPSNM